MGVAGEGNVCRKTVSAPQDRYVEHRLHSKHPVENGERSQNRGLAEKHRQEIAWGAAFRADGLWFRRAAVSLLQRPEHDKRPNKSEQSEPEREPPDVKKREKRPNIDSREPCLNDRVRGGKQGKEDAA